jgi:hypothetical protein
MREHDHSRCTFLPRWEEQPHAAPNVTCNSLHDLQVSRAIDWFVCDSPGGSGKEQQDEAEAPSDHTTLTEISRESFAKATKEWFDFQGRELEGQILVHFDDNRSYGSAVHDCPNSTDNSERVEEVAFVILKIPGNNDVFVSNIAQGEPVYQCGVIVVKLLLP